MENKQIFEKDLLEQIQKNEDKKIAFWGASLFLQDFIAKHNINNNNIVAIIDKNSDIQGNYIGKYKIVSPEEISGLNIEIIIFTIKNNANKIYNCIKNDLKDFNNIKLLPNVFENYNESCAIKSLTPQKTLKSIAIHLVDHCNLKCRGCDHFAPLAEKRFESLEIFEKDIKQFAKLSNSTLEILKLMGGEPLLHPDITKFMQIARKYLPNTRIEVVTNAILLNLQKEEFWQACKQYKITIVVTKYPLKTNYEKAQETAALHGVNFEFYGNTGEFLKTSYHIPLKLKIDGSESNMQNFMSCFHANNCVFLKNGKLYTCTVAPNIEHFNKYFGYNIPLDENDGIDIHKAKNIKEILEFLAKPIPFCKYCDVKNRTFGHPWGFSEKKIEEWTCDK